MHTNSSSLESSSNPVPVSDRIADFEESFVSAASSSFGDFIRYADAATILLRWALAADKCNATHSQCKAYLSAIIVYLYAHDFKEAEKVETFLNSDQCRCASKFLSAYREGDEEEIKRVGQSSIVTNLDHTVLNALVSLFCRSNFSAETLWHGGWLLLQLLPHSDANFNSNHHELLDVDIITIDFSEKLMFRLKQPMVKAAIQVISSRDLEPKLLDAAPDSGVLEMQLESHLAKSEGQDALQGDQQFTLAERMAKALAVMKCLDWNFLGGEW
nr:gamma-soluble NSF attachment protein [Ipomoea batatas]